MPKQESIIRLPFNANYLDTTWLLYKNFVAAITGKERLELDLKGGYQSAISVHMANLAMKENCTMEWKPEYDY